LADKLRLAIFISGRGSNMQAIINACGNQSLDAKVCLVFSDNTQAKGLDYAQKNNIKSIGLVPKEFPSKREYENQILKILQENQIDLICLAGYMRLIGNVLLTHYKDRIINIHPSLLPSFKGLNPQQQALDCGVKFSGATVHFVNEELDSGDIIIQDIVSVLDTDTVSTLSERILKVEHVIYPRAIQFVINKIKQGVST